MPYSPYASEEYYKECYTGTLIPEDEQRKALIQASRHIDTLTYNRIVSQGFSNLTEYQKGNYILTDDQAPVELLGMQVIDELIKDEVQYYKDIYKERGIKGLMESL